MSMKHPLLKISAALAGAIALCASMVMAMPARADGTENIRVLVIGEDSDPRAVKRSSSIHKRVLAELKESLYRKGFQVIDEEMVGADLGWEMADRRDKINVMTAAKMMNASGRAAHRVRGVVAFSIYASATDIDFATKARVRLAGEIYDAHSNRFLGSFELPRKSFPAPAGCNRTCLAEVVGDHARELAADLGDVLGRKLELQSPAFAKVKPGHDALPNSYTIVMKRFDETDALELMDVMATEFPGYVRHEIIDRSRTLRRYGYTSTAKPHKMEKWLTILLEDMGLSPDREISFSVRGNSFIMERVLPRKVKQTVATTGTFQ